MASNCRPRASKSDPEVVPTRTAGPSGAPGTIRRDRGADRGCVYGGGAGWLPLPLTAFLPSLDGVTLVRDAGDLTCTERREVFISTNQSRVQQ